jgi:hypothetical protein
MASLDLTLRDNLSLPLRRVVAEHLWGPPPPHFTSLEESANLRAFFELYYSVQCNLIGRHARGTCSSVETHGDIMNIAQLLQQPLTRDEVRKSMSDFLKAAEKQQHENSINLVARLVLMTKFGDLSHECSGGRHVE